MFSLRSSNRQDAFILASCVCTVSSPQRSALLKPGLFYALCDNDPSFCKNGLHAVNLPEIRMYSSGHFITYTDDSSDVGNLSAWLTSRLSSRLLAYPSNVWFIRKRIIFGGQRISMHTKSNIRGSILSRNEGMV